MNTQAQWLSSYEVTENLSIDSVLPKTGPKAESLVMATVVQVQTVDGQALSAFMTTSLVSPDKPGRAAMVCNSAFINC
jgi:hypothetical protein